MSKRFVAVAALAAVSALALAAAQAQPAPKTFTDPQNRFTFQYPADWPADIMSRPTDPALEIAVGVANAECRVFAVNQASSASAAPGAVRRAFQTAFTPDKWKAAADGFNVWKDQGVVTANSVDASRFWPVQTATFTTDSGKTGYATMQGRPGLDVWQFCSSFDDRDRKPVFDQIFASLAGLNDAALQTQAEAADSQRGATEAANAAAAATAAANAERAEKQKKKR